MKKLCKRISRSFWFRTTVTILILLSAIVVGLETDQNLIAHYGPLLHGLDFIILSLFVLELAIRIFARSPRPWLFFASPWNTFDFFIVLICLLPLHASYLMVVRLFRIFRVLRLVTMLPRLQILVGALLKSIPSISYIALLMLIVFFIYGTIGVSLFSHRDPAHFGNLGLAMLSLFEVITLEGWVDIMNAQMEGNTGIAGAMSPEALRFITPIYFVSFIVLGTMIALNLFVGVIITAIEEQREEVDMEGLLRKRKRGALSVLDQIETLCLEAEELREHLRVLRSRIAHDSRPYRALKLKFSGR